MIDFDNTLPMILNRTLDAIMPDFRELFARFDITEQQWRVLRVLWEFEKIATIELSHRTLLPSPSLVGIIDRLEKKGLVSRVRSKTDRRAIFIIATERGRALEAEVMPFVIKNHEKLTSAVSEEEWMAMQTTLETIAASVGKRHEAIEKK